MELSQNNMKNRTYIVNNWSIDLTSGFVTHRETQEKKRLGEYQLKLLTVLLEHVGEILSRDEITNLVWHRRVIGNNSLPNAIHTLRVALGDENKQQRIIQTIPKLGYLLDPAFCEIIEEDIETTPDNSTESDTNNPVLLLSNTSPPPITPSQTIDIIPVVANISHDESSPTAEEPQPSPSNDLLPESITDQRVSHQKPGIFGSKNLFISLLLVIIIVAGFSYFLFKPQNGQSYRAIEQDQGMYSNIRMFQLVDAKLSPQNDEKLNQRIKDTLYAMNKQIKSNDTHINIYYFVSLRRLDFTFSIENKCNKNQLAMTIYHWRQNDQLLNNLIYREMERKINEMANC